MAIKRAPRVVAVTLSLFVLFAALFRPAESAPTPVVRYYYGTVTTTVTDILSVSYTTNILVAITVQPDQKISNITATGLNPGTPGNYRANTTFGWFNFSTEPGRYTLLFPSNNAGTVNYKGGDRPLLVGARMEAKPSIFYTTLNFDVLANIINPSGFLPQARVTVKGLLEEVKVAALNQSVTLNEDTPTLITLQGTSPTPPTFAIATNPAHGALGPIAAPVNTPPGSPFWSAQVLYTPAANYFGPDSFTFTVSDGTITSPPGTVSLTITPVNDPPTFVSGGNVTVAEDSGPFAALWATSISPGPANESGQTVQFLVTNNSNPALFAVAPAIGPGGNLSFTPALNANGSATITVVAQDNGGTANGGVDTSGPEVFTITVTPVDDAPVAVNDTATVQEDAGPTAINVLGNDPDVDAGPISIDSVTQPANGSVNITGGGSGLTYQPNANYCNTPPGTSLDTFTYTLSPGGSTATVSVTVTCVDDSPVAVADSGTVAEDAPATGINVLANDTDIDGGPISVTSVTQPANGAVVITGGGTGLTYQPNADYCNAPPGTTLDTFTYTLSPGGSSTTVTMTVTCVDDPPVAVNDVATVLQDSSANPIDVLANDTDIDGGPKSIASVTQPANGTVAITGGGSGLTFTPAAGFCSDTTPVTFTYTLTPGTSTATVSVTVACDVPPVANNDSATVFEDDSATAINVLGNDTNPDGTGPMLIASVVQPTNGTVVITGGGTGLTYAPNLNYCNALPGPIQLNPPDTFTYTLTPGGSTATVSVTVVCVDDYPVAVDDSAIVQEDAGPTAIDVLVNDTDVDGGLISIHFVTQPANGTVIITGGGSGLTYQPNANYCNVPPASAFDTFTYTLSPGGSTATVSVGVDCVNDPPSFTIGPDVSSAPTGTQVTVSPWTTNISPGPNEPGQTVSFLVIFGTGQSDMFDVEPQVAPDGTLTFTPKTTASGTAFFQLFAIDSGTPQETSLPQPFSITIDAPPAVTSISVAPTAGGSPPLTSSTPQFTVDFSEPVDITSAAAAFQVQCPAGSGTPIAPASGGTVTNGTQVTVSFSGLAGGASCQLVVLAAGVADTDTVDPPNNPAANATFNFDVNTPPTPVASPQEAFNFVGNTTFEFNNAAVNTPAVRVAGDLLDNFVADSDGPQPLSVTGVAGCGDTTSPYVCATANGASVSVESDGEVVYTAKAGDTAATDSFQYIVSDGLSSVTRTVTLTRSGRVWYLKDNATAGGQGRSNDPFQTIAQVEAVAGAGDYIFVYKGLTGPGLPLTGQFLLEDGQKLLGEAVGLTVPGFPTLVPALGPGNEPRIQNTAVAVNIDATTGGRNNIQVRGLDVVSTTASAITVTSAGANSFGVEISDLRVPGTSQHGIDVNQGSTASSTLDIHNVKVSTGNATSIDIARTAGTLTITNFANLTVSGATVASGVVVDGAVFDATPGAPINPVSAGIVVVGGVNGLFNPDAAEGTGGAALVLTNVSGNLQFTDLDVVADGGAGLQVTGASGFTIGAPSGVASFVATAGPAVSIATASVDLQSVSLQSSNSATTGVSLSSVTGTFSAAAGSTITTGNAAATAFRVASSSAAVTYGGTISTSTGKGVELTNNTGGTIAFTGTLTLNTGPNPAFAATGGGTVTSTASDSTLASTTGVALNVANTNIGAAGLTFRSISANGAANGIVLTNTGSTGFLAVTGNAGSSCTGAGNCTGGAIQNTTAEGVLLTNTRNVNLTRMYIGNTGSHGVSGTQMTDASLGARATFSFVSGFLDSPGNADNESALFFDTPSATNITGRLVVQFSVIQAFEDVGLQVGNVSGTLAIEVSGSFFIDNSDTNGEEGIDIDASGTASIGVTVSASRFQDLEGGGMNIVSQGSGTITMDIDNNVIIGTGGPDNFPTPPALTFSAEGTSSNLFFDITNNKILDSSGDGIFIGHEGEMMGRVTGNVITGMATGDGIRVDTDALGNQTSTIAIQNNSIGALFTFESVNYSGIGDDGIQVVHRDGNKTLNLTITGNTIRNTASEGIRYFSDDDVSGGGPGNALRIANNIFGSNAAGGIVVVAQDPGVVVCTSIDSNTGLVSIDLQQSLSAVLSITQVDTTALATANGGALVTATGTITLNTPCSVPLPTNP